MTPMASRGIKTFRPVMKRHWEPETDVFEPPQLAPNKQMLQKNALQTISRGLHIISLRYHSCVDLFEIMMLFFQSDWKISSRPNAFWLYMYISQPFDLDFTAF